MQPRDIRAAIFTLQRQGSGLRSIARALRISRNTVRRVLSSGSVEVPAIQRAEKAEPHDEQIRALYILCRGNLMRVHEELAAKGVELPYSTLTGFCRRHGLGQKPKERAGRYHFDPGEEMQHDTSPHDVMVGGRLRRLQCASLVLCYSRRIFAQLYPVWNRFWAKVFLTDALVDCGGASARCVVDNASIVVARGNGKDAVMAPEMVAFATRFGFEFMAHELGDANRSARVEGPFDYIDKNFYAGRTFKDLADLNEQLREWCARVNGKHRRSLGTSSLALFATELTALKPLPAHVPDVYALHRRSVDLEGNITLHNNRYSLPAALIDREVSVHETKTLIRVFDGHRLVCEHPRAEDGAGKRSTLPEHEQEGRWHRRGTPRPQSPEEKRLRADSPVVARMVDEIQKRHGGRAARRVGRLHRLWMDYPTESLRAAIEVALAHGLYSIDRLEVLVLRHIAGEYFRLPPNDEGNDES